MEGAPKGSDSNAVEKVVEKLGERAGGFLAKQALNYATAGIVGLASVGNALANPDASGAEQVFEDNQEVAQIKVETPESNLEVPKKKIENVEGINFEVHPEVVFSDEIKKNMEGIMGVFDQKILDLNYQVDRKKVDIERGFDGALAEMNGCISDIEKKGSGDISKECRAQVKQVQDLYGEYKAGRVTDENLLSTAMHVRQIFHEYLTTYNAHREEWLVNQSENSNEKQ